MEEKKPQVVRVRIEYDDGSAREVQGAEDCAEWVKLVEGQGTLWLTRGWPAPKVNWKQFPPPSPSGG